MSYDIRKFIDKGLAEHPWIIESALIHNYLSECAEVITAIDVLYILPDYDPILETQSVKVLTKDEFDKLYVLVPERRNT